MLQRLLGSTRGYYFLFRWHQQGHTYQQKFNLVNVKLKWVKDPELDAVVTGQTELKAACILVSVISSSPNCCLPIYRLLSHRGKLGLPNHLKLSTFIRRFPNLFHESSIVDSGGTHVPLFSLTPEALRLREEELIVMQQNHTDLHDRLSKLLMLTKERMLPLQTIDQLGWDLGLPYDYQCSFISGYPKMFSFRQLPDERVGLRLLHWDDNLAVSQLQRNASVQQLAEDIKSGCLAFPVGFTRGFGLKRKCMEWLREWQKLPYTSPYSDASYLDPRTDVSEKRIVGVFHELLHLTIQKKTDRKNVSNLRKPLALPQKFTKVFERHPQIFYISKKCDTQTVVLRESYSDKQLVNKHPLVEIREKYASHLKQGFIDRSRGLYKKYSGPDPEHTASMQVFSTGTADQCSSIGDSDCDMYSEYESDEIMKDDANPLVQWKQSIGIE